MGAKQRKRERKLNKVQVEMSVDVYVPFRNRQFFRQGKKYAVDQQVAGFLLEGRYAQAVTEKQAV